MLDIFDNEIEDIDEWYSCDSNYIYDDDPCNV